jgi:hypothetical protein
MSDPFQWPALARGERHLGETLQCRVGIWGKVHRQASDYRWIARSEGFGAGHGDLSRALRIGSEDQSIETTAWRAIVGDAQDAGRRDYFAIAAYPSRAVDAFGRQVPLEKLVLHWQRHADGPPVALAALALLPRAAEADDGLWWDRVDEDDWQRPDYALPLDARACPASRQIEAAVLAGQIDQGIKSLDETLGLERLARIYALLLGGIRPVMIRNQARPLPPPALAALLLPLAPERAEALSLSAWVPSMLVDAADVGKNWDLAVTAQPGTEPTVDQADLSQGVRLAEALLEQAPERLTTTTALAERSPADELEPSPSADYIVASELERADHRLRNSEWSLHPNPRLGLQPAPPDQTPALAYLYEFADRINLRRLDLRRLRVAMNSQPRLLPTGEDPGRHPLVAWIQALQSDVPDGVHEKEWQFKIDQLRSAALVLLPSPRTLAIVGMPEGENARIPALLVALALDSKQAGHGLAEHGLNALQEMLRQSLSCCSPILVEEIRRWVGECWSTQRDADLQRGLHDLLAPQPRS